MRVGRREEVDIAPWQRPRRDGEDGWRAPSLGLVVEVEVPPGSGGGRARADERGEEEYEGKSQRHYGGEEWEKHKCTRRGAIVVTRTPS